MSNDLDNLSQQLSSSLSLSSLQDFNYEEIKNADFYKDIPTYNVIEDVPDPYTLSPDTKDKRENAILVTHKWRFAPLYKKNARGSYMSWWVGYDIDTQELIMVYGQIDGKIQVNRSEVETNQSGRSIHEQAILEAKHKYLLKYRNDSYRQPGEKLASLNKPMLAKVWEPKKTKIKYPVYVQPKLDGARCLTHIEGDEIIYRSRGNNRWPHLNEEFDDELKIFFSYIPYQCDLDGEMYMHGLKFSQFSKVLKNMRNKDPRIKDLSYYIYDFNSVERLTMEQRHSILEKSYKKYIEDGHKATRFAILFTGVANEIEDIYKWHAYFTEQGFEGTIIRKIAGENPTPRDIEQSLYKEGRGSHIIKYKDFEDAEGIVVGVTEATGTEKGAALLTVRVIHPNENGEKITTDLTIRPAFSFDERRLWFENPEMVMGKLVTYMYQGISEYGVPRFPVMKGFRDFEGKID